MKFGIFGGAVSDGTLDDAVAEAASAERDGFDSFWAPNIFGHDALTALAVIGTNAFYGAEAVAALARLSSSSTLFNRLNHAVLSRSSVSRIFYPLFKAARRLALMAKGKSALNNPLNSAGLPHK